MTATSSNPALIPTPDGELHQSERDGNIELHAGGNAYGTATITVTVNDGQSANNTVSADLHGDGERGERRADAECACATLTINEDAGQQTVNLSGISAGCGQ